MEHHRQPTREAKECEEALQRCGLLRTRYVQALLPAPQICNGGHMAFAMDHYRERLPPLDSRITGRACSIDIQVGHEGAIDLLLHLLESALGRLLIRPPSEDGRAMTEAPAGEVIV
jgi:hypothetical protein